MKIVNWDETSGDIERALVTALEADDYLDYIKDLKAQGVDPLWYIENLDKVSSCSPRSITHGDL